MHVEKIKYSGVPLQVLRYRNGLGDADTGFDWGNLFEKVTATATDIYKARQQAKAAEAQAKYQLEMEKARQAQARNWDIALPDGQLSPLNFPAYGSTNNWVMPVAIGGALLVAGYFLLKD